MNKYSFHPIEWIPIGSPSLYVYKRSLFGNTGHGLAYWVNWMRNHTYLQVCHESWCLGLLPWCLGYNIYYGAITFSISWSIVCKISILFIDLNVKDHNAFGFNHMHEEIPNFVSKLVLISSSFQKWQIWFWPLMVHSHLMLNQC